ncbi:MAG TPA: nucleic acid-binding protein [Methanocorpusculum sp.]|nr:nucleic acid-binding protein [Methanocorpusculum sp.]HJJ33510.1 nucleic acid-binding protein [Methanocorpusculum sp.]HJJ44596.1 nucleic acid-binding protein [Methanocorpusculum sp.]HJJ59661.1 nucleic acid-binding protein [Methanocorpusculum sp.]
MSEIIQRQFEREPAKRVFAAELREATRTIKDSADEKSPSYQLLPTGERCNRILIAGAITEKTRAGEQNITYRARVSDPTGMFYINASSYQPEAMLQMTKIDTDTPSFVVVVGKPNSYTTPDGRVLVSVRVESIQVVDRATRDMWVADTAKATLKRVGVMFGEDVENIPDAKLARETYPQKEEYWKRMVFDALSKMM